MKEQSFTVLSNLKRDSTFYVKGDTLNISDEEEIQDLLDAGVICKPGDEPKEVVVDETAAPVVEQNTWGPQPDPVPSTDAKTPTDQNTGTATGTDGAPADTTINTDGVKTDL